VSAQGLGEGGPSTRPALSYGAGSGRAAVVSSGQLIAWTLRPRVERVAALPIEGTGHSVHFLNPDGSLLAVSAFSGDVQILANSKGTITSRSALPVGEGGTFVLSVPTSLHEPATVVTRSLSGLTNVWLVDGEQPGSVPDAGLGAVTALAGASDGTGGWIIAADGTTAIAAWRVLSDVGQQAPVIALSHTEDIEAVAVTMRFGRTAAVAIGDSEVTLWNLSTHHGRPLSRIWTASPGLGDHLVVAVLGEHTVIAAAGLEGAHIWLAPDENSQPRTVASVRVPVTSLTIVEERDDLVTIAVADEDDTLHLLTVGLDGHVGIRRKQTAHEEVTRCIAFPSASHGPHLATTSHTGAIQVWNVSGPEISLRRELKLPENPTLATAVESAGQTMLAFTAPSGIMLWDVFGDARNDRLVRTGGGRPSHLIAVGAGEARRILCAYASGSVAVINPATSESYDLELNCTFAQMTGLSNPNFAVAAHGSAIVALRLHR
jgi:WD40 repeat protein